MTAMRTDAGGGVRLTYHAPTRALIGLRSQILTLTRGTGVMATRLARMGAHVGAADDDAHAACSPQASPAWRWPTAS